MVALAGWIYFDQRYSLDPSEDYPMLSLERSTSNFKFAVDSKGRIHIVFQVFQEMHGRAQYTDLWYGYHDAKDQWQLYLLMEMPQNTSGWNLGYFQFDFTLDQEDVPHILILQSNYSSSAKPGVKISYSRIMNDTLMTVTLAYKALSTPEWSNPRICIDSNSKVHFAFQNYTQLLYTSFVPAEYSKDPEISIRNFDIVLEASSGTRLQFFGFCIDPNQIPIFLARLENSFSERETVIVWNTTDSYKSQSIADSTIQAARGWIAYSDEGTGHITLFIEPSGEIFYGQLSGMAMNFTRQNNLPNPDFSYGPSFFAVLPNGDLVWTVSSSWHLAFFRRDFQDSTISETRLTGKLPVEGDFGPCPITVGANGTIWLAINANAAAGWVQPYKEGIHFFQLQN
jgi:hypothetical protein